MPEPREFRVLQNLQAALLAVSVAGGYHFDVQALAVKLDPDQKVEDLVGESRIRPFYVIDVTPDTFTYKPSNVVDVLLTPTIHAIHEADPNDDNSWLQTYYRLHADIEQAIQLDITRGGLAQDTRIVTRKADVLGRLVWAMADLQILVKRTYGQPNV